MGFLQLNAVHLPPGKGGMNYLTLKYRTLIGTPDGYSYAKTFAKWVGSLEIP